MREVAKFTRPSRKIAAAVVVPLVAGAALMLTASPASAATTTKCSAYQYQSAPVTSNVAMKTCVVKSGNSRYAYIQVEWASTYGGSTWDLFKVNVRLERNDGLYSARSCDYTSQMNTYKNLILKCDSSTVTSASTGGWTGDGSINFNFNLDGLGTKTRNLTGSPSVS
jgi:hypothetical protein